MSNEENKNEEEIKEEVQTGDEACDCGHDHDGCEGDCEDCYGDYTFEPIHKKFSCANIFSVVSKVVGVIFFILGTYSYVQSVISYNDMYGSMPSIVEILYGFCSSILLVTFAFWAIGEVTNLINRIKESIMY